jgi:chromosomal replication initiation ATPase DnaA
MKETWFSLHELATWPLQMRDIQDAVADYYGIDREMLLAKYRDASLVNVRHVAVHLCKELTRSSYPAIGRKFNQDHTTIMYACRRIHERLQQEPTLRNEIAAIRGRLDAILERRTKYVTDSQDEAAAARGQSAAEGV